MRLKLELEDSGQFYSIEHLTPSKELKELSRVIEEQIPQGFEVKNKCTN